MQATPIRGPTAFAPTLCFAQVSHDRWSKHVRSDYECRRSKRAWSNCILCIPFILSGSSNECWLHTCNACVITTWRLGLRAPLVARKNYTGSGLGPEGGVIAVGDLGEGPGGPAPLPLFSDQTEAQRVEKILWRPGPLLISGYGLLAPHFSKGLDPPLDRYYICLSFLKWSSLKSTHVV